MSLFAECWVFSRSVDLYLFHPFLQRIVLLTRRREEAKSRLKWRAFKAARKILIQDQYCPSSRLSWHRPPYQMDCRISWVPLKGTLSLLHWGKVFVSVSHATSKLNELRLLTTGNLQYRVDILPAWVLQKLKTFAMGSVPVWWKQAGGPGVSIQARASIHVSRSPKPFTCHAVWNLSHLHRWLSGGTFWTLGLAW